MLRPTLTKKIVAGYALTLLAGALAAALVFSTLATVSRSLERVTKVEQPLSEAAYEMEINTVGTGLGVFKYLDTGNRRYLNRVRDDSADFRRFHAQYQRLAGTPEDRGLENRVAADFERSATIGDRMIAAKDAERALLDRTLRRIESLDPATRRAVGGDRADTDLRALGGRLGAFSSVPNDRNEARLESTIARLGADASRLRRSAGAGPGGDLDEIRRLAMDAMAGERELRRDTTRFVALRERIDGQLDEGLQKRRARQLAAADDKAQRATSDGLRGLLALLTLAALLIAVVAVVVTRDLAGRVWRLVDGTRAVTDGDLSHKRRGRDEVASLTDNFNRMVAELEATTVSKAELEASDGRLRDSVTELEREVAERRRAQNELANEQHRAQVTLDSIGDAVIRTSTAGEVLYLNPKAEELTGWTHDMARGRALDIVLRTIEEASGDSASDLVALCVRDGEPRSSGHTVLSAGLTGGPTRTWPRTRSTTRWSRRSTASGR